MWLVQWFCTLKQLHLHKQQDALLNDSQGCQSYTNLEKCPVSNQRQNFLSDLCFIAFSAPGLCCHRRLGEGFSEVGGRRSDGLYSVSRSLDNIVFPSVIPYRRFASDEATPLTNDPRWLY